MFGQIADVAPDGPVGRAGHGLRPDVAGQQGRLHAGVPRRTWTGSRPNATTGSPPARRHLIGGYHDTHDETATAFGEPNRSSTTCVTRTHPASSRCTAKRVTRPCYGPPRPKQYPNPARGGRTP